MKLQTTICCSAFALTVVCGAAAIVAQTPPKTRTPFSFRTLWTVPLNGSPSAPPVFDGPRGYVPLEDGRLVAYDLSTGDETWTSHAVIHSKPATGDGLIFIVEEGALTALRETDGSAAWRLPFDEPLATPVVWDNGWLIAAAASGSVLAFRATDGELIWRRDLGSRAKSRPALAADRVYIPTADRRVVALRVDSGAQLWERRLGGALNDALALDDRVYVGSDDNFLYCLKADSGDVDWKWPTGADVIGLPATDHRLVYFVSLDNVLRALDRNSGNQRWKRPLPLRPSVGPLRAADAVIVSGVAPMLRAYYVSDGAPAGEIATDGELAAQPYFFEQPEGPAVVVVTRNLAKGAMLSSLSRVTAPTLPVPALPAPDPAATTTPKPLPAPREPPKPAA